jgi:hypothetical protein
MRIRIAVLAVVTALAALIFGAAFCDAQNVRYDAPFASTTGGSGQQLPVYALPFATIKFYSCTGSTCTTLASTYSSVSSTTACPVSPAKQVVLQGTTACVGQADSGGNFGAWFQPGQYAYTIAPQYGGLYGPILFTIGVGAGGGTSVTVNGTAVSSPANFANSSGNGAITVSNPSGNNVLETITNPFSIINGVNCPLGSAGCALPPFCAGFACANYDQNNPDFTTAILNLTSNVTSTSTTIPVASTAGWPSIGCAYMENPTEFFCYDSTTATSLVLSNVNRRGLNGYNAASHTTTNNQIVGAVYTLAACPTCTQSQALSSTPQFGFDNGISPGVAFNTVFSGSVQIVNEAEIGLVQTSTVEFGVSQELTGTTSTQTKAVTCPLGTGIGDVCNDRGVWVAPGGGGGNPSVGSPGQLQMAGATTGTFAASPIDSGITNTGVTTDVLPLYVNPTDGTDQTSMVISSESESSTSGIFVVNDFNGTNTYFVVGGPANPGVFVGTSFAIEPLPGAGTSAVIEADSDTDTDDIIQVIGNPSGTKYFSIAGGGAALPGATTLGRLNTALVGDPVTSGFTQPTNSIAYSWLGSGGFYDNAFIQGSTANTGDFYIGLNVEANGTIPSANYHSAQIDLSSTTSDNTGGVTLSASSSSGGALTTVASFDPVSVLFQNTGPTQFEGSGVLLPANSTMAASPLCTAANAPTICPATAGISSITGPTSLVTGAVSITGSGVSQSGNAFTIGGGGSGCAEGTCVVNAPTSTQTISEVGGVTTALVATNTSVEAPVFGLTVSADNEGPGKYGNNGPWGNTDGVSIQHFASTLGIDHGISGNMTNMTQGDYAWMYAYLLGYGGCAFGADECGQFIKGQVFQVGYSQGFIAAGSSGFINPSPVGNGSGGNVYYEAGTDGGAVVPFTGNVQTLSVNFDAAPAAGSGTIVFGVNNGGGSFTTQILVPITGITATSGTQVFTAGTNFTAFVATAGQVMGFYVASGASVSKAINAPTVGYSLAGAPATGTATYADVGYLPGMSLTMAPVTTGSVNLPISGFGCFAHNNGCQGQSQYGWPAGAPLLDMQASSFTSTMASQSTFLGNPLTFTTTGATYPVSTAFGTIASCTGGISAVTNTWTTTSTTCTVTLSTSPASGYFANTSAPVCLASNPGYVEMAAVTGVGATGSPTQTVTFLAGHPWGAGAVIGQGGMCGQGLTTTASVTAGPGFWPIAFPVIMSPTSSSVMVANCLTGDCFSSFNVPSPAAAPSSGISLTRTSNVVSVTNTGFNINITPFPVGSSIVISGCTVHTDLNGTFTITVNNDNNLAPVLRWAQTGADEGPDATCLKSSPQPGLTFWPMALILSSAGQNEIATEPSTVPYNPGDILRAAPTSAYIMTGEDLEMGQASGGEASGSYLATDHGPSPMTYLLKLINTGGFNSPLPATAPEAIDIEGNFNHVINIKWLPAHNGCIICITATTNPITGAFTPFYLLQDGTGGGPTILADQNNNDFTFNDLIVAPSFKGLTSASQFAAGTTINGILPCLQNGTDCPSGSGGTVTNVSVASANNGVTLSVVNPTTTPALTVGLGAITPTSVTTGAVSGTTGSFTGGLGVGSSPPTACAGLSGCGAFAEAGTAVTGVTGVDTIRADSSHLFKVGLNSGSEFTSLMNYSIATIPQLNQNTTGTAANLSGTPALPVGTTATTPSLGDNSTKLATTAFVAASTYLSGTTGSIGGSLLTGAGSCVTGTATVTGVGAGNFPIGSPVAVAASDGSLPNGLVTLSAAATATNTVTVSICAIAAVTPSSKTYNVSVF